LLLATVQDLVTLVSLAGVIFVQLPWALGPARRRRAAVVPGRDPLRGAGYSLLFQWTPERRLLGLSPLRRRVRRDGEEVKLFNLSTFSSAGYATLSQEFYDANKRLAIKRNLVSTLLVTIGTLGYYAAYAVTILPHGAGRFTVGALTFLAGSFRQSRDLIQRVLLSLSQVFEQSLYLSDLLHLLRRAAPRHVHAGRAPGAGADPPRVRVPGRWGSAIRVRTAGPVRHLTFHVPAGGADRAGGRERGGEDHAS